MPFGVRTFGLLPLDFLSYFMADYQIPIPGQLYF